MINSNLGLISHRYWDTTSYWPKIANFDHPPLIYWPRSGWPPSNSRKSFTVPETRVFQAADGKNLEILAWTVFAWSTRVADGRTDRQTELRWLRRAESIAAFARNYRPDRTLPRCDGRPSQRTEYFEQLTEQLEGRGQCPLNTPTSHSYWTTSQAALINSKTLTSY